MALLYGLRPKNKTDPRTGTTHSYKVDAVLEVAGRPAKSPYDPQFNPRASIQ